MLRFLVRFVPLSFLEKYLRKKSEDLSFMKKLICLLNPEDLEFLSRKKALASFSRALTIPAYKRFLKENDADPREIQTFSHFLRFVPVTSKENYVKKAKTLQERCVHGSLEECSFLARSSGYSGASTTWAKSRREQETAKTFASLGLDHLYGVAEKRTLLIDAFALGSWVSGVDLLLIGGGKCTIVAPGADIAEALSIYRDVGREYEQVIFAGTPPFLKILIEEGIQQKISFSTPTTHLLVGGEAFPESWRSYMKKMMMASSTGKKMKRVYEPLIYSAFGASDLGVTGINETKESAALRGLCLTNPALCEDIFGFYASTLPHLFQYDPTHYFIEKSVTDELLFTHCDLQSLMPLIRYNIHDMGNVRSYTVMNMILKKHHVDLQFSLPFPFVFVVGRSDGTVDFVGDPIYPQYIEQAVYKQKNLQRASTGVFKLRKVYDSSQDQFLHIDFQLKKGIRKNARLQHIFHHTLEKFFLDLSSDFRINFSLLERKTKKSPLVVNLYEYKQYPHKSGIKIRRV